MQYHFHKRRNDPTGSGNPKEDFSLHGAATRQARRSVNQHLRPYRRKSTQKTRTSYRQEHALWRLQSILRLCPHILILAIHNLDRVCVSTIESLFNDHSTAQYILEISSEPEIVATDGSITTVHKNLLVYYSKYYKAALTDH
jgi:hypothetical protein